jgi:hypothetical protein
VSDTVDSRLTLEISVLPQIFGEKSNQQEECGQQNQPSKRKKMKHQYRNV